MSADPTVLVVDDEPNILFAVERIFFNSPIRILKASDAEMALHILTREKVQVIISDQRMPGSRGIDLLEEVKRVSPETVKIMMTAYADLSLTIEAINRGEVFRFIRKPWDEEELVTIVEAAVQRNALLQAIERTDELTLLGLAQAVELKDPYTRGHCERVAQFSDWIADALQMDATGKRLLKLGSWLHDCGKIGVPDSILNNKGPLDPSEFDIVKHHPEWGAEIARQARLDRGIEEVILHHHEHFDGQGYPRRLQGEEIPLLARIVAVADTFDALRSERPYQKKSSLQKAWTIMEGLRGKSLDPHLVEIFFSILQNHSEFKHGESCDIR